MKKIISVLTILLFTSMMNSQNNFQLHKDHDAILVKDLDASAKFYSEILGLKEIPNGGLPDHIRWFELAEKVQIHLIESEDVPEKHKGVHMALNTSKLSELMEFLKSEKVPFENWTGEKETTNTRPDGIKQIYLQDPDGYWIEINDNSL
ncbi:VOC family protein [Christiangramia sp. SM2212]|uniref:VOC family protein n=1 Tax=Christiangramia sediminicola TaxID=3073267 RepID=A0ABU1EU60_9FLAO|nr:VOC family protein [Christiangramia sp. SM2212]MDR5591935.1 VOC family protein [Christiangramia sp. SM2212]